MYRGHLLVVTALLVLALGTLSVVTASLAQPAEMMSQEEATELANDLARCAGFFDSAEEVARAAGHTATAEQSNGQRNGAALAAMYVLATEYNGRNPSEPRPLRDFEEYVEDVAGAALEAFRAMLEADDYGGLTRELDACAELQELTKDIVQTMREAGAGR
jgi:uncharacterized membrane protein YccC